MTPKDKNWRIRRTTNSERGGERYKKLSLNFSTHKTPQPAFSLSFCFSIQEGGFFFWRSGSIALFGIVVVWENHWCRCCCCILVCRVNFVFSSLRGGGLCCFFAALLTSWLFVVLLLFSLSCSCPCLASNDHENNWRLVLTCRMWKVWFDSTWPKVLFFKTPIHMYPKLPWSFCRQ